MTFKILSLDGGGTWALFEVMALIKLYDENTSGHQVLSDFDMVAANSAGSLVLAGLVENLSLKKILDYFMNETNRRSLFQNTQTMPNQFLEPLGLAPKYSEELKLPAIRVLLPKSGSTVLDGSMNNLKGPNKQSVHLLVVGFDYDRNRAVFFRSAPARRRGWGQGQPTTLKIAEAVHASTNAPVSYFDWPARIPDCDSWYWDGGISGCNNPSLVAIVEATVLGHDPKDLRVLSLGAGTDARPMGDRAPFEVPRDMPSIGTDLKKLAKAILDDPPDAATYIAHVMTGGSEGVPASVASRIVRMSPLLCALPHGVGNYDLPKNWSEDQFRHLCNIDLAALDQNDANELSRYGTAWLEDAAPNQPIAPDISKFDPAHPEIGYAFFSQASAAWLALSAPPPVKQA